jgi:hypothetical protein
MLPFGVTIPATVPQRSEIPEGLMNYPVLIKYEQETHNAVDKKSSKVHIRTVLWNKMKNKVHAKGTRGTVKCKRCGRKW